MTTPVEVLQVVADGRPGGGTTHVLQILEGLADRFSFGIVTQRDSYLLKRVRDMGLSAYGADFFRGRLDPRVPLRLRRLVRESGARLLHVHGGRAGFFHALAGAGVPAVYTVHGYWFPHMGTAMRVAAIGAERLAVRRARRVVFVSNDDRETARRWGILAGATKSDVIHNGLRLGDVPEASPSSPPRVGFVGRLHEQKDPLLFLDVVARLPEGYEATIVGGGELEGEVRAGVEERGLGDRVRTTGQVSHAETLREISALSALVMTSRWETFGYVAAEAMYSGVPVVGTRIGGLDELVETDDHGLLVEGRSPDTLAAAVERVVEDATLREHIVENARTRVRTLFSEERMLAEIGELYDESLSA